MVKIILWLLAIWVALSLVGALVKGLLWLAVLGGVLFLGTAAYGAIKSSNRKGIKGPR
jgi:hypothetical protein